MCTDSHTHEYEPNNLIPTFIPSMWLKLTKSRIHRKFRSKRMGEKKKENGLVTLFVNTSVRIGKNEITKA